MDGSSNLFWRLVSLYFTASKAGAGEELHQHKNTANSSDFDVLEFRGRKKVQCLHQTESCLVHLSSLGCHTKTTTTMNVQEKTPSRNVVNGFEKEKTRRFLLGTRLKSFRLASLLDEKLSFSELGRWV